MIHNKAFVYALIIVPVSSLGTTLPHVSDDTVMGEAGYAHEVVHQERTSFIGDTSLSLDEQITFVFDAPVSEHDTSITVSPKTSVKTSWNGDFTQLTVTPRSLWNPDTSYTVAISQGDISAPASLYNFRANGYPQIARHFPDADQKNFVVEPGAHLDIIFDRPIDDFDFRVITRGIAKTRQEVDEVEKMVRVIFEETLGDGSDIEPIVYVKHKSQSNEYFYPVDSATLWARAPQPAVWPTDTVEREKFSLDRTIPKRTEGKYIDINLAARLTTLFEDGVAVYSYVNSPGAKDTPTLTGEFKIENKGLKPLSRSFGVYLPYWMAFTPDGLYGLHDLVEWPAGHPDFPDSPGGGKESITSIDAAVSPGCVRHDTANSGEIYAWADIGTPVIIY